MSHFDSVIMVDWSGANSPTTGKDSIWIVEADQGGSLTSVNPSTRGQARAWLFERLDILKAKGHRVLLGFDFAFAYPVGALPVLGGGVQAWANMAARVEDDERNANNRFELASHLNRELGAPFFWGRHHQWPSTQYPDLPKERPAFKDKVFRRVEGYLKEKKGPGRSAKSVSHIAGAAGVVGSQVIMGMPTLHALKQRYGAALGCWPFEKDALEAQIVLAEIYPSLVGVSVTRRIKSDEESIKDRVQVETMAQSCLALQEQGKLAEAFALPRGVEALEEGWILGATDPFLLDAAMTAAPISKALKPPPLRDDCFALPAGVDWTPVDAALADLRARLHPVVGLSEVRLSDALGRVLAEDVTAKRSNPPQANSAVDGYGFAFEALRKGDQTLPLVQGRAAAGVPLGNKVPFGSAVRILTGAAVPEGVDTVILEEDVTLGDGAIAFREGVKRGANTRKAGEDVTAGDVALEAGRKLTPADLALAAAVGLGALPVYERLRVGVLSTGDELVEPGEAAGAGQIYDANRVMLLALLDEMGFAPVDLSRVGDDRAALAQRLDEAADKTDVILTSGGASAGDEDHVSALLKEAGAMAEWRIAIKPGRPLALGMWRGTPVFGLPGNPVAALVCTLVFARPAMGLMAGRGWLEPEGFMLPAAFEKRKKPGRREFLRARMRGGAAEVFASEGSGRISGLSWAEGLVELPDGAADIGRGDRVKFIPYASFL